jgi:arsenate reductase-like glutaredoxin family protein
LLPFLLLYGCASYSSYPVDAELLDEAIKTTVDSTQAQYYLNHYLQGNRSDAELDQRIDAVYQRYSASFPKRAELKQIAQQFSNDFAALYLADRLWQEQQNREVQSIFHDYLSKPEHELYDPPIAVEDYVILLVPGWNYTNNGHVTGSDFAAPRRLLDRLGIDNHLLLVPPNGSVMQSASVIADALIEQHQTRRRVIVVGASAAGPAIHYTLGKLLEHSELEHVVAWVNLGGILHGSPLIDYFQQWPQRLMLNMALAYYGWDSEEIMTMSAEQSRERVKSLSLPQHVVVINYMGLSLTGSLSSLSRYKYPLIADQGPNDGLTPLVDIIAPNSMTLIATGSDHYFGEDPEINKKTIAMVKTILDLVRRRNLD